MKKSLLLIALALCALRGGLLCLSDNKNPGSQTATYDEALPTAYFIWSKWFENSSEYSSAVSAAKEFFDKTMTMVYLSDLKDICDIAPCCKQLHYGVKEARKNSKYIHIEYDCSDLETLFKIAAEYNGYGRDYVLRKYAR